MENGKISPRRKRPNVMTLRLNKNEELTFGKESHSPKSPTSPNSFRNQSPSPKTPKTPTQLQQMKDVDEINESNEIKEIDSNNLKNMKNNYVNKSSILKKPIVVNIEHNHNSNEIKDLNEIYFEIEEENEEQQKEMSNEEKYITNVMKQFEDVNYCVSYLNNSLKHLKMNQHLMKLNKQYKQQSENDSSKQSSELKTTNELKEMKQEENQRSQSPSPRTSPRLIVSQLTNTNDEKEVKEMKEEKDQKGKTQFRERRKSIRESIKETSKLSKEQLEVNEIKNEIDSIRSLTPNVSTLSQSPSLSSSSQQSKSSSKGSVSRKTFSFGSTRSSSPSLNNASLKKSNSGKKIIVNQVKINTKTNQSNETKEIQVSNKINQTEEIKETIPDHMEEIYHLMDEYRKSANIFTKLSGYVSQFQLHFEQLSLKKLNDLYVCIFAKHPAINNPTEIMLKKENKSFKKRLIQLESNFLFVGKENKGEIEVKKILYIRNPMITLINDKCINLNKMWSLQFENNEKCIEWIRALNTCQEWFISVPRVVLNKDMRASFIAHQRKVEIVTLKYEDSKKLNMKEPKSKRRNSTSLSTTSLTPRSRGLTASLKNLISPRAMKTIKIVGIPLEQLSEEYGIQTVPQNLHILIEYLKIKVKNVEGIMRVSGSKEKIQTIIDKLDSKNLEIEYFTQFDIHSVVGALKLYINKLPSQVIPKYIENQFEMNWNERQQIGEDELLKRTIDLIRKQLAPIVFAFLKELFALFRIIIENENTTKMTIDNVVTCIQPSFRGYPFILHYLLCNSKIIFEMNDFEIEKLFEDKIKKEGD